MRKVEIDIKIGNSQIKGEFDRDFAKMMIEKMLENNNGNGNKKAPQAVQEKAVVNEPERFYRRAKKYDYKKIFNEVSAGRDFFSMKDLLKAIGLRESRSLGGARHKFFRKVAKKHGFTKVHGGFRKDGGKTPPLRIQASRRPINDYNKIFRGFSEGKDYFTTTELAQSFGKTLKALGGQTYSTFVKIAKKHGFEKEHGGFRKIEKGTSVTIPPTTVEQAAPERKRSPSEKREITISKAQIEACIFTIGRSIKTFTVSDVMKAMNINPPTTSNPEYLRIYWVLGGMSNRGIVTKTCYIVNDGKKTFYSIPSKAEKKADEEERLVLPPDTTDDILSKIISNYNSFNWEALTQVKNKHGNNYQRYSAKALFDWMCRNTEYLMHITGKKITTGGSGDFRFIQVLG